MGNSKFTFNKAPSFLAFISWILNDCQGIYTGLINSLGPWVLNNFVLSNGFPVMLPLFKTYFLDVSPIYNTIMDSKFASVLLRTEALNAATGVFAEVPAPADLRQTSVSNPTAVEMLLNNHIVSTLLGITSKYNDNHFTITDEMAFSNTGFLHLRTSDFRPYIPGLMTYKNAGDVPMELVVTIDKDTNMFMEKDGEFKLTGKFQVGFNIPKAGEAIKLEFSGESIIKAAIDHKVVSGKIMGINISDLKIVKSEIAAPNVLEMKQDFNVLFKFIANGLNTMILKNTYRIPDVIVFSGIQIEIYDVMLKLAKNFIDLSAAFELL